MAGYVSLLSNVRGPDSLRRVLPRSGSSGCALTTARERDEALARYTTLAIDENGEWWLPALRLAAASALLRDSASPLAAVLPVLLERCAAELIYAGGATVPWVSGRCERVPQAQMNLPALGVRPSLLSRSERVVLSAVLSTLGACYLTGSWMPCANDSRSCGWWKAARPAWRHIRSAVLRGCRTS